ncbi:hypothetical protein [Variovorax sp. LT1R16]|uniref:hypothetical protein n=1 Tax=Variovorax sp. LT1R16 TaxID=3443728 RepID=UPI003F47EB4D
MQKTVDDANDKALLGRSLDRVVGAIDRINTYAHGHSKRDLMEPMRQDAIAHSMGLIAHNVLGLQSISSLQKHDALLNHWVAFFWDFTWKSADMINWDSLWDMVQDDLPRFGADMTWIAKG